jgi:hypothetical protein
MRYLALAITVSAAALFIALADKPYQSTYPSEVNGSRRSIDYSDAIRKSGLASRILPALSTYLL